MFVCMYLVFRGLDLDISEKAQSREEVSIVPPWERNHTNVSSRYYIPQRMKTGKLSEWLCLGFELDTWNFTFTIIITIWALSSSTAWADFIGLSGIGFNTKSFVLSRSCFLTLTPMFFFLLIRVKFSTERDAVLFALKVSVFLWKCAINTYFDCIVWQEK